MCTSSRLWKNTLGRWGDLLRGRRRTKGIRAPQSRRPQLEPLEQRQMLTILYWDPVPGGELGGSGTWSNGGNAYWYDPLTETHVAWDNNSGDDAVFTGTADAVGISGTVSAHSISFATDGYTLQSGTISLPIGGTEFTVDSGMAATIASVIDGSGELTKDDPGTLVLTGNNTYTGQTTIDAGTLQIGNGGTTGTLGTGDGDVTVGASANLDFFRTDVSPNWITISNDIDGSGAIHFTSSGNDNTGSYRLDGDNTYFTGTMTVDDARLKATDDVNFGGASLIVEQDGQIYVTDDTFDQSLTLDGGGWSEDAGELGALRLHDATWEGNITLSDHARISAYQSTGTLTGDIVGDYVLALRSGVSPDGDTIHLELGPNTDYGNLKIGTGVTVVADSDDALNGDIVTMEGGTLQLNGRSFTIGSLTGDSGQIENGSSTASTLTVDTADTTTYSGTLADGGAASLSLEKAGDGSLTLAGSTSNTYTGTTTVSGGALRLDKSGAVAVPGDLYFEGGTNTYVYLDESEQVDDSANIYFNNTDGYGRFSLWGHTETVGGIHSSTVRGIVQNCQTESNDDTNNNATFIVNNPTACDFHGYLRNKSSGTSTGTLALVKQGAGTLTLSGSHIYYTGGTTVSDGTLVLQDVTHDTFETTNIVTNASLVFDSSSANTTFNGVISGAGSVTKSGGYDLTLGGSSSNTYTGNTIVTGGEFFLYKSNGSLAIPGDIYFEGTANSYIQIRADEQIADTANLYFNNTENHGRVNLRGHVETVSTINAPTGKGVIQNIQSASGIDTEGTLIVNGSANSYYSGYIRDKGSGDSTGVVSLVKSGTGTLTLSGSHIYYTGGTMISDGTLVLQNVTHSTFAATSIVDNATLEFNNTSADTTFSGVISGTGSVEKTGSYALMLAGSSANTYAGATRFSGGQLNLGKSSGVTAVPGDLYCEGDACIYVQLYANEQINNSSVIHFDNTGNLGRLNLRGYTETVAGITALYDRGIVQNVQGETGISNNGTLIVDNQADFYYAGFLRDKDTDGSSGIVSLVKQGPGKLTLAGSNITYTGGTTISAGTLTLQNVTNSGFNAVDVINNGTLEFLTTSESPTFYGDISGSGNVVKSGTRNLALGGANSFTGEIHVYAGRFRDVSGPGNFGDPSMIFVHDGGQIYTYNDEEYDFPLSIAGNGHVESAGTLGALRLRNDAVWAGDITLTDDASISAYDAMAKITGNITDGLNDFQLTFRAGDGYPASGIYLEPTSGNNWSGGTLIAGAVVRMNTDNALPSCALQLGDPNLGSGGLDLNGHNLTVSSLSTGVEGPNHSLFWDEVSNTSSSARTLKVDNSVNCTYAGVLSGNLALEKDGTGTLTLSGQNYNVGNATVLEGTLDITKSYLGSVSTQGTGQAIVPDLTWYSISVGDKSGQYAGDFDGTLTGPSTPIGVHGGWEVATMAENSVEGALGEYIVLFFIPIYTFGELYGGFVGPTGQAYRVGTVGELDAAVRKMHNGQDAFSLDDTHSPDTMVIVAETRLGYTDCDYDYDDVYWVIDAQQIDVSLDINPEPVQEGSEFVLTLGSVTGTSGTINSYTIHWGDGSSSETYTETELNALSRHLPHTYPDGPANPTITVDLTIDSTLYTGVSSTSVTVQNVAPEGVTLMTAGVLEGVEGAMIGTLSAIDPGLLDTHTYEVSGVMADTFEVVNGNWLRLKTGEALDFDAYPYGRVTVPLTVTDNGGAGLQTTVDFFVVQSNEVSMPGPMLTQIVEDALSEANVGDTVSDIVASSSISGITAMAITSVDDANGTWQYALYDSGTGYGSWVNIEDLSLASALLLGPDDKVRFVPTADFAGTATFTFRAWDQSTGVHGTTVDVAGDSSIGTETDRAWIQVAPVNDTPELNTSATHSLAAVDEDILSEDNLGSTVAEIVADGSITDVDFGDGEAGIEAIAIVDPTSANGTWQYQLAESEEWLPIEVTVGTCVLLLGPTDRIRFVPNTDYYGSASFTFRAWDQFGPYVPGQVVECPSTGDVMPFSTDIGQATITVNELRDAPVLDDSLSPVLPSFDEDPVSPNPTGSTVGGIIPDGAIKDVLGYAMIEAIAVTAVDNMSGTWQYKLDGQQDWSAIAGTGGAPVSETEALLLGPDDLIRFVPIADFCGVVSITFRAWDTTSGQSTGTLADTTFHGGASYFSGTIDTASVTINAVNDSPQLGATTGLALTSIDEDVDSVANVGDTVSAIVGTIISDADVVDAPQAIVVTSVDDADGTWQYRLDGGLEWVDVALAADMGLLLGPTDRLRFVPNVNFFGSSSFTFRAWDQTDEGVPGELADVTSTGGDTPFSGSDAGQIPIVVDAVNDPLTRMAGNVADLGVLLTESEVSLGLGDVAYEDPEATELTYEVTAVPNSTLFGTIYYYPDSVQTAVTIGVSCSLVELQGMTFTPAANAFGTAVFSFDVVSLIDETPVETLPESLTIGIDDVNVAPTLVDDDLLSYSYSLSAIIEDDPDPVGNTVASILGDDAVTEVYGQEPVKAIAVTAVDNTNGTWQFRLAGEPDWPDWYDISLTGSEGLLLGPDDQIRFLPDENKTGQATLTFHAWDQSTGIPAPENRVTAFSISTTGGTTPFSERSDTATIQVIANDNTTNLDTSFSFALSAIPEDVSSGDNPGNTIAEIVPDGAITDGQDNVLDPAIAITGVGGISGTWKYALAQDDYANWTAVGSLSESNALLLGPEDMLRFEPAASTTGVAYFTFKAWDLGDCGTAGDIDVDTSSTSAHSEAFSPTTCTGRIAVTSETNPAPIPVLDATFNPVLTTILEGNQDSAGNAIADFIAAASISTGSPAIAITAADTSNGTWQYQLSGGGSWTSLGALSDTNARLLGPDDKIRFVPSVDPPGYSGTATFTFRAWNATGTPQLTAGSTADVTASGNVCLFSTATDTASITVADLNERPQFSVSASFVSDWAVTENAPHDGILGKTVESIIDEGAIDDADGSVEAIAITSVQGVDSGGEYYGLWQYCLADDTTPSPSYSSWVDIGSPTASSALLLGPEDKIRFLPDPEYPGTAKFTFHTWDQSDGALPGSLADTTGGSDDSAFSGTTAEVSILVIDIPNRTAGDVDDLVILKDASTASLGLSGLAYSAPGDGVTRTYVITAIPDGNLGVVKYSDGTSVLSVPHSCSLEILQGLVFDPNNNSQGGSAVLEFEVRNDDYALTESLTITVTHTNAPVVSDSSKELSENPAPAFAVSDFTFSDVADSGSLETVKIVTLPEYGTLVLDGTTITQADTDVAAADLDDLVYVPGDTFEGEDTFRWTASDGTDWALEPAVMTLTGPALLPIPVEVGSNGPSVSLNLDSSNFIAALRNMTLWDDDYSPADLVKVKIESLPSYGTLYLDSTPVSAGAEIPIGDLEDLRYDPSTNPTGEDSFTWNPVFDIDSTLYDSTFFADGTVLIDVSHAPLLGSVISTANIDEDESSAVPLNLLSPYGNFADSNFLKKVWREELWGLDAATEMSAVKITALPIHGTLYLEYTSSEDNTPADVGDSVLVDDLDDLCYLPDANFSGTDYFEWTPGFGADPTTYPFDGLIDDGRVGISVVGSNDTPTIEGFSLSVPADGFLQLGVSDFAAHFEDVDGDAMEFVKITDLPDHGDLFLVPDIDELSSPETYGLPVKLTSESIPLSSSEVASLTYRADPGYNGPDSFSWQAVDAGTVWSSAAVVTLNGTWDVDDVTKGPMDEDDTEALTFTVADFSGLLATLSGATLTSVTVESLPQFGTLKFTPDGESEQVIEEAGVTIVEGDLHTLKYLLEADSSGTDTFDFSITYSYDSLTGTTEPATVLIDVTAVNDDPVAYYNDDTVAVIRGGQLQLTLGDDGDWEADDVLILEITSDLGPYEDYGTFEWDSASATVVYTPDPDYPNDDFWFSYTLTETGGEAPYPTCSGDITIIQADLPIAHAASIETAEDTTSAPITLSGEDGNGDTLTFEEFTIISPPSHGTFTLDDLTHELVYTPDPDFFGEDSLEFVVSYSLPGSETTILRSLPGKVDIIVNGTPDAPVVTSMGLTLVESTNSLAFSATDFDAWFKDPDGDTLDRVKITYIKPGCTLSHSGSITVTIDTELTREQLDTLVCSATPDPSDPPRFEWKAIDSEGGLSDSATVFLNVVSVSDLAKTIDENTSLLLTEEDFTAIENDNLTVEGMLIDALPSHGTLWLGSDEVILGQTISRNELDLLWYIPDENFHSERSDPEVEDEPDEFTFRMLCDFSGDTFTSLPVTVTITINAVDAPPTSIAQTLAVSSDTSVVIPLGDDGDPELDQSLILRITSAPTSGTLVDFNPTTGEVMYIPDPTFEGTDSFSYRLIDAADTSMVSEEATVTLEISLPVIPPTADDLTVDNVVEDPAEPVVITLSGSPAQASGTVLTYEILDGPAAGTLEESLTNPEDFEYTPDPDYNGEDSFTYVVIETPTGGDPETEGVRSAPATVTIEITPVNDVPIADAQMVAGPQGEVIPILLTGDDGDWDTEQPLTFVIDTLPSSGTLLLDETAVTVSQEISPDDLDKLTYEPSTTYAPQTSFTFHVSEEYESSTVDSDTATVTIFLGIAPVAVPQVVSATDEDTPVNFTLSGQDPDATWAAELRYAIVTQPEHGFVEVNLQTGQATYTPDHGYNGSDSFEFAVYDENAAPGLVLMSEPATVSLTVNAVDSLPDAASQEFTIEEDTLVRFILGKDLDSSLVAYQIVPGESPLGTLSDFDPLTGEITYTPPEGYTGDDQFTFALSDGTDRWSASATVTIHVEEAANHRPTATPQVVNDVVEDTARVITLSGSDGDDGTQSLVYLIVRAPEHGVLSAVDGNTVTYTPDPDYSGSDSFAFVVTDDAGDAVMRLRSEPAEVTIEVDPVNDTPIAFAQEISVAEDQAVTFFLGGEDGDSDVDQSLIFAIVSGPNDTDSYDLDPDTGELTLTPDSDFTGDITFTYTVTDDATAGGTALTSTAQTVTLHVEAIDLNPVAQPQVVTTSKDQYIDITLAAFGSLDDTPTLQFSHDTPSSGSISLFDQNTGSLRFTPASGFVGVASFTFTVIDTSVDDPVSSEATVVIHVKDVTALPVAGDDEVTVRLSDGAIVLDVLANDTYNGSGDLEIISLVQPDHGTASISAGGDYILFDPEGYTGSVTIGYTIEDASSNTDSGSISVTIDSAVTAPEDGEISIAGIGFDCHEDSEFTPPITGNVATESSANGTLEDGWTDPLGNTHEGTGTQSSTTSVTSASYPDGNWTYSETATWSYDVVEGNAHLWGTYTYTFSAGSLEGMVFFYYTMTADDFYSSSASESSGNPTAGHYNTYDVSGDDHYSLIMAVFGSEENGANAATSHFAHFSNSTNRRTGNYWYASPGGRVAGTSSASGSYTGTQIVDMNYNLLASGNWLTTGSMVELGLGTEQSSYSGEGAYASNDTTGSIHENGSTSGTYHYMINGIIGLDVGWDLTGTGFYLGYGSDNRDSSGTGAYTRTSGTEGVSWEVAGTKWEGESTHESRDENTTYSLVNGKWVADGSITADGQTRWFNSYQGNGTFEMTVPGGTVSGPRFESGTTNNTLDYNTTTEPNTKGKWTTHGTGTGVGFEETYSSHSGTGSYTKGDINGWITRAGSDQARADYHTVWSLPEGGEWTQTDTSSDPQNPGTHGNGASYNWAQSTHFGSGTTTTTTNEGAGSFSRRSITDFESGDDMALLRTETDLVMVDGQWEILGSSPQTNTTGHGEGVSVRAVWSEIEGTYGYDGKGVSVRGTLGGSGLSSLSTQFTTELDFVDTDGDGDDEIDGWTVDEEESTGSGLLEQESVSWYEGNGTYNRRTLAGNDFYSSSGTVSEGGIAAETGSSEWAMTLVDEEWVFDSQAEAGSGLGVGSDYVSYEGTGTGYRNGLPGGPNEGTYTVSEETHDNTSFEFQTTSDINSSGEWVANGDGSAKAWGDTYYRQTGNSLPYSRYIPVGLVGGTFEHYFFSKSSYQAETDLLLVEDNWVEVDGEMSVYVGAGKGESYEGTGAYIQTGLTGTFGFWALAGTVTEKGGWESEAGVETESVLTSAGWDEIRKTDYEFFNESSSFTDSGKGYYHSADLKGTFSQSYGVEDEFDYVWALADDDPDGLADETFSTHWKDWDNWSYNGSGSWTDQDTGIKSTLKEWGSRNSGAESDFSFTISGVDFQLNESDYHEHDTGEVRALYTDKGDYETFGDDFDCVWMMEGSDWLTRGQGETWNYDFRETYDFWTDTWVTTGTNTLIKYHFERYRYDGEGGYITDDVTGDHFEDGTSGSFLIVTSSATLNANGRWSESNFALEGTNRSDNYSYTSDDAAQIEDTYTYGDISGTFEESGKSHSGATGLKIYTLQGNNWTVRGFGLSSISGSDNYSFNGDGDFVAVSMSTGGSPPDFGILWQTVLVGNQEEHGSGSNSYRYTAFWEFGRGDRWLLSGGSGTYEESASYQWNAAGSDKDGLLEYSGIWREGYPSIPVPWTVWPEDSDDFWSDGTVEGDFSHGWNYSVKGTENVDNGRWVTTLETGQITEDYDDQLSYSYYGEHDFADSLVDSGVRYTAAYSQTLNKYGYMNLGKHSSVSWTIDTNGSSWKSSSNVHGDGSASIDLMQVLDGIGSTPTILVGVQSHKMMQNETIEWSAAKQIYQAGVGFLVVVDDGTSTTGSFHSTGDLFVWETAYWKGTGIDYTSFMRYEEHHYDATGAVINDSGWAPKYDTIECHAWGVVDIVGSEIFNGYYHSLTEYSETDMWYDSAGFLGCGVLYPGPAVNLLQAIEYASGSTTIPDLLSAPVYVFFTGMAGPGQTAQGGSHTTVKPTTEDDLIVLMLPPANAHAGDAPTFAQIATLAGADTIDRTPVHFPSDWILNGSGQFARETVQRDLDEHATSFEKLLDDDNSAFALLNRLTADLMPGTSFTDAGQDVRNGMERAMDSAMLDVGLAAAALRGVVMNSSSKTVTKTGYDDSGNLTDIQYNDGTAQHWEYDPVWGQVAKYIDQEGRTTRQQIDPESGRVLSVTQIVGEDDDVVNNDADPYNDESDDLTTSFTYTDGSGTLPEGLLLTVTDPEGNVTLVGYDADPQSPSFALATSITYAHGAPDESTIYFGYDNDRNLDSLTDAEGNVTQWTWVDGRVATETITLNSVPYTRYYTYDNDDRLWRYTDRLGRTTEYLYDAEGRLEYERWFDAGDDPDVDTPIRVITYGYDPTTGLLASVDDTDVDFTYTYDAAGYLSQAEWEFADDLFSGQADVTFTYGYNRGDLTSTQTLLGATADYQNAYGYDDLGRLERVEQTGQAGGNAVAEKGIYFEYTGDGLIDTITRWADADGDTSTDSTELVATTKFTYDNNVARLTGIVHSINNTNEDTVEYAYTYEPDGQIDTIDSSEDGLYDYDYDAQGQLTDVSIDEVDAEHYEYDSNGNRTGATAGSSSSAYAVGQYNRLESVDDGANVWGYGYDAEGNLVLKFLDADESESLTTGDAEVTEYAWDHRNRLISVVEYTNYDSWYYFNCSSCIVEYGYDYLNRLVSRTIDVDGTEWITPPETEYFVYDAQTTLDAQSLWEVASAAVAEQDSLSPWERAGVREGNPTEDLNAVGQMVLHLDDSGNVTHRYLWGPAVDLLLADEQIDLTPGNPEDVAWPLLDHQHTVRDILAYDDVADEWLVANHLTYDAYGNTLSQTDAAITCLFHYTARPLDEATGLQNNLNRWYDPELGRWVSEDPIGFAAGETNLERYVDNDAVNWFDPSGLQKTLEDFGGDWDAFLKYMEAEDKKRIKEWNSTAQPIPKTSPTRLGSRPSQNPNGIRKTREGLEVADAVIAEAARQYVAPLQAIAELGIEGVLTLADLAKAIKEDPAAVAKAMLKNFKNMPEILRDHLKENVNTLTSSEDPVERSKAAGKLLLTIRRMWKLKEIPEKLGVAAGKPLRIRNAHLAGKKHPVSGIPFDKDGYPDFSSVAIKTVQIEQTGKRASDFAKANKAAGLTRQPEGYTWHHHQDCRTMQLVPTDVHQITGHTGGVALGGGE